MISVKSLEIPVAGVVLQADVNLPESAQGVVLFVRPRQRQRPAQSAEPLRGW